jgi:Pentapeptide repeats (9 copies)
VSKLLRMRRKAQGWIAKGDTFVGEDLRSLSAFQSQFADCSFEDCKLGLADFTGARLYQTAFRSCSMPLSSFRGAILDSVSFIDCDIEQGAFTGAVLRDVRFFNCRMSYANLAATTLRTADFRDVNFHGADLDLLEAHGVSFLGCDLWGVKVGMACAVWNAKFDERAAGYFAAMLARVHPNEEAREKLISVAGRMAVKVVDRLMRERDHEEKEAETEEIPIHAV